MEEGERIQVFEPVVPLRAYDEIVRQIEQAIKDGVFPVSAKLPGERDMATRFGVSRVVVREAMRTLEARGIVEVLHGSGTYVRRLPTRFLSQSLTLLLELEEASLLELYAVRSALELLSARLAAQHSTSQEVDSLRCWAKQMAELAAQGLQSKDDFVAVSSKDVGFHLAMARASGNVSLAALVGAILPLIFSARTEIIDRKADWALAIARTSYTSQADRDHFRIAEAVASRDPEVAERVMQDHLERSMVTYRDWH